MSINQSYRRVSSAELDGLLAGSADLLEKWFGETSAGMDDYDAYAVSLRVLEESGRYLDITNSWQSIHFLLTGEFCFQGGSQVPAPLKNVVMGGTPTDIETTYGVAFYLTPAEVAEVARALEPLPVEVVAARYDAKAFREAQIYPANERWNDDGIEDYGINRDYENLRAFFIVAAQEGQAMLIGAD